MMLNGRNLVAGNKVVTWLGLDAKLTASNRWWP
jgi:hypothetical protein